MKFSQVILRGGVAAMAVIAGASTYAAGSATQPPICTRSCWAARAPVSITQMSSLTRAVIHHTAGAGDYNTSSQSQSAGLVRSIQNYHMDVNGWSDIGYHFLTDKLGNNFEGRSTSISQRPRGSHDAINTNSFGFNILGYMHPPYNHTPTTAQRNSLYALIAWKMPNGYTPYGSGTYNGASEGFLCGHRDVGSTVCPGDTMYPYITTNLNGGEARNAVANLINGAPPVDVIVDNASTNFSASTNWWASTSSTDFYGSNYHVRATAALSDPASFTVTLPSDGTYKVFAWWSAGTNRSTTTPYQIVHTGGTATVNVNQQANGGKWNELGTWQFYQGTAVRARVSCWTTAGFYVVADGIRFVKQ